MQREKFAFGKEVLIDEIANLKIRDRRQRELLMVENKELRSEIMEPERIVSILGVVIFTHTHLPIHTHP